MSDPLFNGRTFAENLNFLDPSSVGDISGGTGNLGWFSILLDSLNAEAAGSGKSLEGFFAKINKNSTNAAQNPNSIPLPQTWEEFIRAFRRDYLGQNPPLPPETNANATYLNAVIAFYLLSGHQETTTASSLTLEQVAINENLAIDPFAQFKDAFADFLQHYPYQPDGSAGTSLQFFQNLNQFLGITATVLEGGTTNNAFPTADSITSYEEVFNAFPSPTRTEFTSSGVPVAVTPTFQKRFGEFYKAYVAEHGYFATGRAFDEWSKQIQSEYASGLDTSFPLRPPGYTGVSRAITQRASGTTTTPLFASDTFNTQIAQIAADALPETGVFVNFAVTPPGLFNSTTDKFTFQENQISGFTIFPDGTGTFMIKNTYPGLGASVSQLSVELHLRNVLRNISYVSGSPLIGERTISFTLNNTSGTTITMEDTVNIKGFTSINTSVTTDSSVRVLVLNRLFKLIAEMIDVLQQVAASQAQYLTFLTQWQKAFTDLISEIKTFTRADGSVFGQIDSTTATVQTFSDQRNQANQLNLNLREKLSNLRGVAADTAKRIQSRINQSQDAATQQGQFATSLVQQLSTLLGAIYR